MILNVKKLIKNYKEKTVLNNFNLEVNKGEILGLLGPNGCGKTTAINCILSLLKFTSGEIKIFDEPMNQNALHIKKRIGLVPQEVAIFYDFTVYENIDYFCGLYITKKSKRKQLVNEAIEFTGLTHYSKYKAKHLSGGLLRRLNIACGIAHKPELIFMDEPTVAVDAQSRNFILDGIKQLAQTCSTIVYTTHYLEEVEQICNKIVIMDNGKIIANGTLDELKKLSKTKEKFIIEFLNPSCDLEIKLKKLPQVLEVIKRSNDYLISFKNSINNINEIIKFINSEKLFYTKLYSEQLTLNDIFLELTGKELRDE